MDQSLQITITAEDEASGVIDGVSATVAEMEDVVTGAGEEISTVLTAVEEQAIDASLAIQGAFDFGADMSTSVELAAENITEALFGIDTSAATAGTAAGAAFTSSFTAATDPLMASIAETMAEGDEPAIAAAATIGAEAGTTMGGAMGGAMKDIMIGGIVAIIGSLLSGGIAGLVAAAQKPSNDIATTTDQINKLKAAIDTQEASLQHSMGTHDQMVAKQQAVAAAVAADKEQIVVLNDKLAGLQGANENVASAVQGTVNNLLLWLQGQPQLTAEIDTFVKSLGLMLKVLGGSLIAFKLIGIAINTDITIPLIAAEVPVAAFIGWGLLIAAAFAGLVVIWDKWGTQITSFFKTLSDNTGVTTIFHDAWKSIVDLWNNDLKPALDQLGTALKPLEPYIKDIGEVLGGELVVDVGLAVGALTLVIDAAILLLTWFTKLSTFIVEVFTGNWKAVGDTIKDVYADITKITSIGGGIGAAISGAVSSIIPKLADGGIVNSPTLALIGEAGPEAVIPLSAFNGGSSLGGSGGGSGSGNIVINVGSLVGVTPAAARSFSTMLGKQINQQIKLKLHA